MPDWLRESAESVKESLSKFSSLKTTGSDWNKKFLNISEEKGKRPKVAFPKDRPHKATKDALMAIATLAQLSEFAGYEVIYSSKTELVEEELRGLDFLEGGLRGVIGCILQPHGLRYTAKAPTPGTQGWAFAQWYMWATYADVKDANSFMKVKREIALVPADTHGSIVIQGAIYNDLKLKVTKIAREASIKRSEPITFPHTFVLSKGKLQEMLVGKKPSGALYLSFELERLVADYEARVKSVGEIYDNYFQLSAEPVGLVSKSLNFSKFSEQLQKAARKNEPTLEAAKGRRAAELSERVRPKGKGRGAPLEPQLVPGGTLVEKLRYMEGGKDSKSIATVLYSPIYLEHGCNRDKWEKTFQKLVDSYRSQVLATECPTDLKKETIAKLIGTLEVPPGSIRHGAQEAMELYFDCIEMKLEQKPVNSARGNW
jgi:hypothetical protein